MIEFAGRRVLVTGAASGVGLATARHFAADGARLVLVDVDGDGCEQAAASLRGEGAEVVAVRADVSDPQAVDAAFDLARRELGGLDCLLNIAGVLRPGPIEEVTDEDWTLSFDVNVRSCMLTARRAVPMLREAGGGTIVNMSSVTGVVGVPAATTYSATKGAIIAFSKALAREVARDSIRVNAVCPSWIDTSFNDPIIELMGGRDAQQQAIESEVPLGRQSTPEEIAKVIRFLAGPESSFITAQALVVDGGFT